MAMPKMIQLRHVPDHLHRTLKARAALVGLPLSDYLLQEVRRVAERPTLAELQQRLTHRTPVVSRVPPARAVRAERERSDRGRCLRHTRGASQYPRQQTHHQPTLLGW